MDGLMWTTYADNTVDKYSTVLQYRVLVKVNGLSDVFVFGVIWNKWFPPTVPRKFSLLPCHAMPYHTMPSSIDKHPYSYSGWEVRDDPHTFGLFCWHSMNVMSCHAISCQLQYSTRRRLILFTHYFYKGNVRSQQLWPSESSSSLSLSSSSPKKG